MPALTSIRALFAWWVVLFHFSLLAPFHLQQTAPWIDKGDLMVDCFYILSGFVLFHAHAGMMRRPSWRGIRSFLIARIARIYPLYLAMLLLFLIVVGGLWYAAHIWPHGGISFSTPDFFLQAAMLQGWGIGHWDAWNFPSYSVSSEWAAYLAAPVFFWLAMRFKLLGLLIATAILAAIVTLGAEYHWVTHTTLLPDVLLEFVLGVFLARLRPYAIRGLRPVRGIALVLGWLGMAALIPTGHPGWFLAAMVWTVFFLSFRERTASGWWSLPERWAIYLGRTSYAVYLCHALIALLWVGIAARFEGRVDIETLPMQAAIAVLLAVAIQGMASVLYVGIENPARIWLRDLGDGRKRLGESSKAAHNGSATVIF